MAVLQVPVPDRPGVLAEVTATMSDAGVNIEDLQIVHSPEGGRGTVHPGRRRPRTPSSPCASAGSSPSDWPESVRAIVHPGAFVGGVASVPGDKSIAHRWLILAATALGVSELRGLPGALDVRATATCLAGLVGEEPRGALEGWASIPAPRWTVTVPRRTTLDLEVEASCSVGMVELPFTPEGRAGLLELGHDDAAADRSAGGGAVRVGPGETPA